MNIQALREKISNLANNANHLLAEKGDQAWSTEDQAKFDGFTNEIDAAKNQINAIEKMRELEADKFFNQALPKKEDHTISALDAVALYLRHGSAVTAEQAIAIRNAMSTTTTTEGGYTVPAEVASMVIDKLKAFGGMRAVSTTITTASGVALSWPTSDGTAELGAIVGQNVVAPTADITFGTVGLNPFYYTSNQIALPLELIQDSAVDIVGFVVDRLATRIARKQNSDFTIGAGTTLPDGVIPRAGVGKTGATGQTLTVTYDDLVDLKHSVDAAYRTGAKFMLNDLSVATVSKLKDSQGRPLWIPAVTVGAPDTILGHAVQINNDVAVMAANAKSIAFGDLSQYYIRDVAGTTSMLRFEDSAFALKHQVGFVGFTRSGGNLVETSAVKVYVNSAT